MVVALVIASYALSTRYPKIDKILLLPIESSISAGGRDRCDDAGNHCCCGRKMFVGHSGWLGPICGTRTGLAIPRRPLLLGRRIAVRTDAMVVSSFTTRCAIGLAPRMDINEIAELFSGRHIAPRVTA